MSLSYVSDEAEVGRRKSKAERQKARAERKERRQRTGSRVGKIALAPARAAFIGLVSMNALNLAKKLADAWKKDKNRVLKFWFKFSGKEKNLKEAIERGSRQGLGVITAAAALATATPLLIAVAAMLKELKIPDEEVQDGIDDGLEEIEKNPDFDKGYTNEYLPPDQTGVVPGGTKPLMKDDEKEATTEKSYTGVVVLGLIALLAMSQ